MFPPRINFSCRLRLLCLPCLIFPGILKIVFLPFSCSWYIKKVETYYEIIYTDFVGFYLTYPCQYKIAFFLSVGIYWNWLVFTGLYVNNCHWDIRWIVSVTYRVNFPLLFRMTKFIERSKKTGQWIYRNNAFKIIFNILLGLLYYMFDKRYM